MIKSKVLIVAIFVLATLFSGCQVFVPNSTGEKYTEEEMIEKLQGFWVLVGGESQISEEIKRSGRGFEIDDEKMDMYSNFSLEVRDIDIEIVDIDTIEFNDENGKIQMEISFKTANGYELLILDDDDEITQYEKIDKDNFYLYEGFSSGDIGSYDYSTYLSDGLTDKELAWYIADIYWNELYYEYADGSTEDMNPFSMVMFSTDMTGIMQYVDETLYVDWEVYDGKLYLTYEDGESYYFPIDYAYDEETKYSYLYLYDTAEGYEGCAWVLWNLVE